MYIQQHTNTVCRQKPMTCYVIGVKTTPQNKQGQKAPPRDIHLVSENIHGVTARDVPY